MKDYKLNLSIHQKMVIFTLGMVWLATISVGMALFHFTTAKERRETLTYNEVLVKSLATQGDALVNRARLSLQRNAMNLSYLNEDTDLDHEIRDIWNSNGFYDAVYYADDQYRILSGYPMHSDQQPRLTTNDVFREVSNNHNGYFSDAFRDRGGDLVAIAVFPVYKPDSVVIRGYLVGSINLQKNDLLSSLFHQILLPADGYGYVVDSSGHLIYHPEAYRINQDVAENPFVKQVTQGRIGSGEGVNIKGVTMLAAFRPMATTGWGVVVQSPKAGVEKRTKEDQKIIFSILVIISLVMIPLTLTHGEILMRPLRGFFDGVRNVAKGDFSTRVPVISQDEIGWLTQQFNEMVEQLDQLYEREREKERDLRQYEKLSVIGELAAGLAHEIRNPLTPIKGYIQLLLGDAATTDKSRQYLNVVLEEVNGLERIVNEFLLLSKPGFPKRKLVYVGELLQRVALLVDGEARAKNIHVEIQVQGEPWANLDYEQISQVVLNLALNGLQAMVGEGHLVLSTFDDPATDNIYITVSDTGEGIAAEHLDKLGQPFYTTKEKGTGLGLTISYRIIQNHGGQIYVESTRREGTKFTICLPKQIDHDREVWNEPGSH